MAAIDELTGYRTIREVSEELGVSTQYVHKLIKQDRLDFLKTPLGRLIPAEAVEQLRKEREAGQVSA